MQIPGYFEDMNYLHVNTEPDRAYYNSSLLAKAVTFWIGRNQTGFSF